MIKLDDTWHTGRLEQNGEIVWAHGYTSAVDGPLCGEEAKKEARKYARFFSKLFDKMHEVMKKEMKKQLDSVDERRFKTDMVEAFRVTGADVCKDGCDLDAKPLWDQIWQPVWNHVWKG